VDADAEGAFRILATGHPTGIFDCHGVSADSVVRGVDDYFATLWAIDGDAHLMDGQWWPVWLEACRANVPIIIDPDNELLFEYAPGYTEEDNEWYDCRMKLYYFWRPAIGGGPDDLPPRVPLPPGSPGGPGDPSAPTPVDTTTPPPPPAAIACTLDDGVGSQDWAGVELSHIPAGPDVPPDYNPAEIEVCAGPDASTCMSNSPGVWVGSLPLVWPLGGYRHAAISTTPPMRVSELAAVGTPMGDFGTIVPTNDIDPFRTSPRFGNGFPSYRWVRIAGVSAIPLVDAAVLRSAHEFQGISYLASSNRFISNVLRYSNLSVSAEQKAYLGDAWGICWCGAQVCPS